VAGSRRTPTDILQEAPTVPSPEPRGRDHATEPIARTPGDEDLPSGTVIGEYVVDRRIGRGGMGAVYSIVHPVIGKRAAVKVIAAGLCQDPLFVQRFVDEARAVNLIRHPNIVESFSIGVLPDGRSYYAMEWLEGMTLGQRMNAGPVSLLEVCDIIDQVADALEAVHEKGVIHRDIKPQNLFLTGKRGGGFAVKVLDFGLAKRIDEPGAARTLNGVVLGTPGYASPEQLCGDPVDHRTDIYALGVVAYQTLVGALPFAEEKTQALRVRIISERAPSVSQRRRDVPPELERLVAAMLEIDPARRPSLAQVRRTLHQLVGALMPAALPPAPRRRWMFGTVGLVAVGSVAIGLALAIDSGAAVEHRPAPAPTEEPPVVEAPPPVVEPQPAVEATPPVVEPPPVVEAPPPVVEPSPPATRKGAEPPPRRRRSERTRRRQIAPEKEGDDYLLEPGSTERPR
jgi:hypothetical protein